MTAYGFTTGAVLVCMILAALSIILSSLRLGISPMPGSPAATRAILDILRSTPVHRPVIYELGSGWATVAVALAKEFPSAKIVAVENSPIPFWFGKLFAWMQRQKNIVFVKKNFFTISLCDADIVVCYLYTGAMTRLKEKFEEELGEHAVIVSNTFAVPGWKPYTVSTLRDVYRTKIYAYRVCRDVAAVKTAEE